MSFKLSIGKLAFAGRDLFTNEAIAAFYPADDIDKFFLRYALAARDWSQGTDHAVKGATLNSRKLHALPLAFPPLPEQRRIADRLDAAMTEIAAARAAVERERADAARLVTVAVENALGGRAIAAGNDPSTVGPDWCPLSEVARLESGHTPSRRHPEWWGGDVRWIALPDIRALDGATATETTERTNELGLKNSSARLLPAGTVVLSRTASVGFVTVMGRPMATSQDFVNWTPGNRLRPWFLAHALIAARDYVRGLSEGAIHKTIYMPTLKALRVRLPCLAEQDKALARITAVQAQARVLDAALTRQRAAIDALGPALLTAAFRGEL